MIARNKDILWTELDGKVALLDVNGGRYYEVNKLGSVIWHLLEEPRSTSDIVDHIISRFRVDQASCETDVSNFLGRLGKVGLIAETATSHSHSE
ncbi:MAG: PqqD family peptide modification chaperone [Pseudomonadota bacterium]